MTIDELIVLLQDLEVPESESAALVTAVGEQGWTDEVKTRVLATIDAYAALKQEETDVLEKTRDILEARDDAIATVEADTAATITAAADEMDQSIAAAEADLATVEGVVNDAVTQAPAAAPASAAAVLPAVEAAPAVPVQPVQPPSPTL